MHDLAFDPQGQKASFQFDTGGISRRFKDFSPEGNILRWTERQVRGFVRSVGGFSSFVRCREREFAGALPEDSYFRGVVQHVKLLFKQPSALCVSPRAFSLRQDACESQQHSLTCLSYISSPADCV